MNNILTFSLYSIDEVSIELALRVRQRRLELNLTQRGLAQRADVSFASYRRFEQTGEISLKSLLRIAFALNCLDDFKEVFTQKQYTSFEDAINGKSSKRSRGRKN